MKKKIIYLAKLLIELYIRTEKHNKFLMEKLSYLNSDIKWMKNQHRKELLEQSYSFLNNLIKKIGVPILRILDKAERNNDRHLRMEIEKIINDLSITLIVPNIGDKYDSRLHEALECKDGADSISSIHRYGIRKEDICIYPALVDLG